MLLKRFIVNSKKLLDKVNKMSPIKKDSDFVTWENMVKWGKLNNGKLYVWFKFRKPVATIFVNTYKNLAMISNFEVAKQYKHRGIGTHCFKQIQKLYKNKTIILEIKKHTTLKKFYSHFGILPVVDNGAYESKEFNLLSSNPNLGFWDIQNYFWKEDDSWNKYNHMHLKTVPVLQIQCDNIMNFE